MLFINVILLLFGMKGLQKKMTKRCIIVRGQKETYKQKLYRYMKMVSFTSKCEQISIGTDSKCTTIPIANWI